VSSSTADLYGILGVPQDASQDAIKKAYRKIARENHPDVHPGDKRAEERFKEASRAYEVLSDVEQRKLYDEFGEAGLHPNFDPEAARQAFRGFGGGGGFAAGPSDFSDLGDLFGDLFGMGKRGGAARGFPRKGRDLETTLQLSFLEAAKGGDQHISVDRPTASGSLTRESVVVRIPAGVADGGRIRLAGKGGEGVGGGPPGDLYAVIRVGKHPFFKREGRDLHLDLPVSISEAVLGAQIEVPTLEGKVTLTIPPGTDSGKRLRLRGKGIADPKHAGKSGDLYVTIQIVVPRDLDPQAKEKLAALAAFDPHNLRDKLAGH